MESVITKIFSQRKVVRIVNNDCGIAKNAFSNEFLESFVSRAMLILVFLCFSFATLDAKSRITDTRYVIEGVETGLQGTYLVKVSVYSKKSSVTTEELIYAAVHGTLFRGFKGEGFGFQKPIAKPESEKEHSDFFNVFFNNGNYLDYAKVVNPVADRVKVGKEYKISAIVSVSKDELRKNLESAGVINSLNTAF